MNREELAAAHGCEAELLVQRCQCGKTTALRCDLCRAIVGIESSGPQECIHVRQLTKSMRRGTPGLHKFNAERRRETRRREYLVWCGAWTGGLFSDTTGGG